MLFKYAFVVKICVIDVVFNTYKAIYCVVTF